MEGIARLVEQSMARLGIEPAVDHRRLPWSRWSRLESSFDLCLVPSRPGLFAVGEEISAPGEFPVGGGKRMLAVLSVAETEDLGLSMVRLFAPGSPLRDRIAEGRVFARYAVIDDDSQRKSAHASLQRWLAQSTEAATGISSELSFQSATEAAAPVSEPVAASEPEAHAPGPEVKDPSPIPAGF